MPKTKNQKLILTRAKYQPKTIREEDKSVEFVLATDNPALMYREGLGYVDESLIADGALVESDSVPLLNCHDRYSVDRILGSVREIKAEGEKLTGRLYFAETEEGKKAFDLVKSGHLSTGSVGYYRIKSIWIPENEKIENKGKTYNGPLLLTTEWGLDEFSLVPVPADKDATVREKNDNGFNVIEENTKEIDIMPTKTIEEQKQVQTEAENKTETVVNNGEELARAKQEASAEACKRERERILAINDLCNKFDCKELATRAINENMTIEQVNKLVLDELCKRSVPLSNAKSNVTVVADEKDKFINAVTDGLLMRAGIAIEKTAAGAEDFRGFGFVNIAQAVLQRNGNNRIHSNHDTLELVMRAGSQSYSDFNNILDGAVRKTVMAGYKQAPQTWRLWASKGTLENLEPTKRVGLNDIPDLKLNREGEEINHTVIGDKGEQVKLDTYGNMITLTRRAILADDLSLFNKISVRIGARCAQKVEAMAYGVLTGNANMSDNKAIFHADHHNLLNGTVLSKEKLALAFAAMQKQTDENGSKLNIMPKYLIVSPDDAVLAETLTTSITDVSSVFTTGNTNFFRNRNLVAISTAFISQSDGFFLVADPSECDTVEVDFLGGKEAPTIEMLENNKDILSRSWRYYFDIGAKALDFRGMNKTPYNAG